MLSSVLSPLSWVMRKGYAQGAFWAVMICVVSVTNDVLMRLLGHRLDSMQIIFFRFFFSMLTVLPMVFSQGFSLLKTNRPGLHGLRALVGVGAIGACCYSVNLMPLAENTTIMFSQPLFFLPLAVFFLKEHVGKARWLATAVGFLGLILILQPGSETFRLVALIPMLAALLFASLDIMAKKMVATESTYAMLFYFAFGTTVCAFVPALFVWQTPTWSELGLLVLLGIGANLIQVCLIRAFSATEASGLMPFRYVELIFSTLFGYLFFSELPSISVLYGAPLIIFGAFYVTYMENKREKTNA